MKNPPVELDLPAGAEWHDLQADLPVRGTARIIRIYLPADKSPVEIESMSFTASAGKPVKWQFSD